MFFKTSSNLSEENKEMFLKTFFNDAPEYGGHNSF